MEDRTVHATISEGISIDKARKKIQDLIEQGILKDAGYKEEETGEKEQTKCPECGNHLVGQHPEFQGGGKMSRIITCNSCDYRAVEYWEITDTRKSNIYSKP